MEVKWTKVTDQLPEPNVEYLVWTGTHMIVSYAEYYDSEDLEHIPQHLRRQFIDLKGYFEEFGSKYYFNEKEVQYAELPEPPKGKKI